MLPIPHSIPQAFRTRGTVRYAESICCLNGVVLGLLVFKFGIICDILVDIDKMVSTLDVMVERLVSVITTDGRHYVGILKGFDQALNIILSQAKLFSWEPLLTEIDCKAQIIRGDTVVLIGLLESSGLLPDSAEPLKRSL